MVTNFAPPPSANKEAAEKNRDNAAIKERIGFIKI